MKNILKEKILSMQNKDFSFLHPREKKIPEDTGKIISVVGPRRSGKSSFLYTHIQGLLKKGVQKEQILFLNFEDERLSFKKEDLSLILDAYRELFPEIPNHAMYCFFDEIQVVDGWELFVRRIYDEGTQNIFITGSNAKLLSREIATSLRGRNLSIEMLPLSFSEYVAFQTEAPLSPHLPQERAKMLGYFDDYLAFGGFPELLALEKEFKIQVLQEYFDVMIFSDIVERYRVSDFALLKQFLKQLVQTSTKEFSVHKISNDLKSMGFRFDKNVLYTFLEYVENIFFGEVVSKYDFSLKKQYLLKKFYSIDNGFLQALSFSFSDNFGKLLENALFLHLRRKHSGKIYFLKNGQDINFLIHEEEQTLYQSCYQLTPENRDREILSLEKAMKGHKIRKAYIITRDQEESLESGAEILPFYRLFF